jgi:hypothetical protein
MSDLPTDMESDIKQAEYECFTEAEKEQHRAVAVRSKWRRRVGNMDIYLFMICIGAIIGMAVYLRVAYEPPPLGIEGPIIIVLED